MTSSLTASPAPRAHLDADELPLVSPEWIAKHLEDPDVCVVEVDVSPAAYEAGHIPGAILWDAYNDLRHADYAPIDATRLQSLLCRSGVSADTTIIFYGYGAYLGFWLMKRYGHRRAQVMDGPRERWAQAGFHWSAAVPERGLGDFALAHEDTRVVAPRAMVQAAIGQPDAVLLDVRSAAEFSGKRFWPSGATHDAGRVGHIPGALHLPCELMRGQDGKLQPSQRLRSLCESTGLGPERRVITYCTIGNRASQVWFALTYVLGYRKVCVYYGSWVEWGKQTGTPIET
ncbi:MAG: thiosulfate/3-mercaptopyruvate sulfurtransferase [Solirubrobacteraceae bacterium]|nr:thiosulfate/3-mercaptopyruvate sulfurtransferase [Solirubrobacteraceae bacterium]